MMAASCLLTACNGVLDGLYDGEERTLSGTLYIDASSWSDWHYIDLHAIHDSIVKGAEPDTDFPAFAVPTKVTAEWDGVSSICTYWYDVLNTGLDTYELRSVEPVDTQGEPAKWDIAIHRNNVRTNGGAVYMTPLTNINEVGEYNNYSSMPFVEDELDETNVWVIGSQMMSGLIGNQRIKINKVLGSWLKIDIPPIPPAFTHNDHVFIVRFADGTYGAIRLADFVSSTGTKCCMTIEYKYPLK